MDHRARTCEGSQPRRPAATRPSRQPAPPQTLPVPAPGLQRVRKRGVMSWMTRRALLRVARVTTTRLARQAARACGWAAGGGSGAVTGCAAAARTDIECRPRSRAQNADTAQRGAAGNAEARRMTRWWGRGAKVGYDDGSVGRSYYSSLSVPRDGIQLPVCQMSIRLSRGLRQLLLWQGRDLQRWGVRPVDQLFWSWRRYHHQHSRHQRRGGRLLHRGAASAPCDCQRPDACTLKRAARGERTADGSAFTRRASGLLSAGRSGPLHGAAWHVFPGLRGRTRPPRGDAGASTAYYVPHNSTAHRGGGRLSPRGRARLPGGDAGASTAYYVQHRGGGRA